MRVAALGKKGTISELLKSLGGMSPDERRENGPLFNGLRDRVGEAIAARKAALGARAAGCAARLRARRCHACPRARSHAALSIRSPRCSDEITAIFADLGFAIAEGPDVEYDDYNFTKLNIPPDHPARQMHDTFYVAPPERRFASCAAHPYEPGAGAHHAGAEAADPRHRRRAAPIAAIPTRRTRRCFISSKRSSSTRTPISAISNGWSSNSARAFFEVEKIELRARPSFFPFTEPSVEWDMRCDRSGGQIKFGTGNDWLELGGSGMVHPRVLEMCGIDPERYQGFAFGFGLDRMAMLKYGAPDLRPFFRIPNLRWLRAISDLRAPFDSSADIAWTGAGSADEIHALLAEGASRDRRRRARRSPTR